MTARRRRATAACLAAALALPGCEASSRTSGTPSSPPLSTSGGGPTTTGAPEPTPLALPAGLPPSLDDLARVCSAGVGVPGAAAYEQRPGVHPIVLFEAHGEEGALAPTTRQLPDRWVVQPDEVTDEAGLASVQLVGCSQRHAETPNGTRCPVALGSRQVELELVDARYDLTVFAARSGQEVGSAELAARSTTCPDFVSLEEGATSIVATPSDEQVVEAIRPFVAR